jgi:hypothetical protein
MIYLAWQVVPGIHFGDYSGATTFRDLESSEREEVRAAFRDSFLGVCSLCLPNVKGRSLSGTRQIKKMGISPLPGAKRLVWDRDQKVVYLLFTTLILTPFLIRTVTSLALNTGTLLVVSKERPGA